MLETSARLLRLLSLLQARRDWTSTELAARLGVTPASRLSAPRILNYLQLTSSASS